MRTRKAKQLNEFVGPHDVRCLGCGERYEPPLGMVCQECRAISIAKLAQQLEPSFVPSQPQDVYLCLRETEVVERYQGYHANYEFMFDMIFPIAERDRALHRLR